MPDRKKDFPCLICNKHVKKTDKAVQCSLCNLWVHITCQEMPDECFKILDNAAKYGGMHWSCRSCQSFAEKFNVRVQELNRKVTAIEGKLDSNIEEVDKVKLDMDTVKTDVKKLKEKSNEASENSSASVFAELRDRDSRKMNIVVHNMEESDAATGRERADKDKVALATLCDKIEVELEISDIKFASRLGEQSPDSSRPLLIGFKDLKVKNDILNNAHKLSNSDDNDPWASVNVIQDLTKQQRKEELALRDEMKKKNLH